MGIWTNTWRDSGIEGEEGGEGTACGGISIGNSRPSCPLSSTLSVSSSRRTPHNNPSNAASHHSHTLRLLPAILLSLIALSLVSLFAAFLFHRRRKHHDLSPSSPKRSNKPTAPAPPAPLPPPPLITATTTTTTTSSYFLYLGTFISNQSVREQIEDKVISSPELRPLPPLSLSREFKLSNSNNYQNVDAGTDSDDEFYSPKEGSATN